MAHVAPHPSGRRRLGTYDYPTSHRAFELACFAAFGVLFVVVAVRVVTGVTASWSAATVVRAGAATVAAYAVADLLSGLVHLLFDTCWSPDTPIIGPKFVTPFRDHHRDPLAMTKGDFVAVNGDNLFVCLPVLVPAVLWLDASRHIVAACFLLALVVAVMLTNQIHKWAHLERVPRLVRAAQDCGLILSSGRHQVHHTAPFASDYCITWGRMNPLLNRLIRGVDRASTTP